MPATTDKAAWDAACAAIQKGALDGALSAVVDHPEMICLEVVVEFSELLKFDKDSGRLLMDTQDPKSSPAKVNTRFVAAPTLKAQTE